MLIALVPAASLASASWKGKQKLSISPKRTPILFRRYSEELGFIGAIIVIALFAVYGWRGLPCGIFCAGQFRPAPRARHHCQWFYARR